MIPLSKAVMRMSTYDRTNQELSWYDEPIYLCTTEPHIARKIEAECQRRKICHYKSVCVHERSTDKRKVPSLSITSGGDLCKVGIWMASGLERKQMADWAITTFNYEEMVLPADDIMAYNVWIQPSDDIMWPITGSEEEYYLGRETHWV